MTSVMIPDMIPWQEELRPSVDILLDSLDQLEAALWPRRTDDAGKPAARTDD